MPTHSGHVTSWTLLRRPWDTHWPSLATRRVIAQSEHDESQCRLTFHLPAPARLARYHTCLVAASAVGTVVPHWPPVSDNGTSVAAAPSAAMSHSMLSYTAANTGATTRVRPRRGAASGMVAARHVHTRQAASSAARTRQAWRGGNRCPRAMSAARCTCVRRCVCPPHPCGAGAQDTACGSRRHVGRVGGWVWGVVRIRGCAFARGQISPLVAHCTRRRRESAPWTPCSAGRGHCHYRTAGRRASSLSKIYIKYSNRPLNV